MRKTINVLTMLFAIFSMAGCSESEPEVVPQAFLSADRLIFDRVREAGYRDPCGGTGCLICRKFC